MGLGATVCLAVSSVNPGQFLTSIVDVIEWEVEKMSFSRTNRWIMSNLQQLYKTNRSCCKHRICPCIFRRFNVHLAKIEFVTAVLLKVLELLDPEDEGTMAVRNVGISNRNGLAIKNILFFRLFTDPAVMFVPAWGNLCERTLRMFTVDRQWDRSGTCYLDNSAARFLYINIVDFWLMLVAGEGACDMLGQCAWFCSRLCVCF